MAVDFFNAFGHHGWICKDPPFTVNLPGEGAYGLLDTHYSAREIIEWLVMADHGVPFGEVHRYCRDNDPKLNVTDRRSGKVIHFTYNGGKL